MKQKAPEETSDNALLRELARDRQTRSRQVCEEQVLSGLAGAAEEGSGAAGLNDRQHADAAVQKPQEDRTKVCRTPSTPVPTRHPARSAVTSNFPFFSAPVCGGSGRVGGDAAADQRHRHRCSICQRCPLAI